MDRRQLSFGDERITLELPGKVARHLDEVHELLLRENPERRRQGWSMDQTVALLLSQGMRWILGETLGPPPVPPSDSPVVS